MSQIDLTVITKINNLLRQDSELTREDSKSICELVNERGCCPPDVPCDQCPLAHKTHNYKKIQKQLNVVNLIHPGGSHE